MNGASLSDEQLALQFRGGNEAAFEALVHRYHGPLLGYLYRMCHDLTTAEEMVQESFVRFCITIDRYKYPSPVKPYIYAIAANRLKDHYKSAYSRRVDVCDDFEQLAAGSHLTQRSAYDEVVHRLERREVVDSLATLPYPYREVLTLRFYQDLSVPQIAQVLGIPQGTVKSRLHGAIQKLKQIMRPGEVGTCADSQRRTQG